MGAWSFAGRGSPPHRRQAAANGSGGIFRDKMSRFAVFSVLLVAYTGITLGMMLWNGGDDRRAARSWETLPGEAGGDGRGGSSIRLGAGGLEESPGRPATGEVTAAAAAAAAAALIAGEPLTGGHNAGVEDGEGDADANDGAADSAGVIEGDAGAHGAREEGRPGPAQPDGQVRIPHARHSSVFVRPYCCCCSLSFFRNCS